ncbi:MAG: hypothetical protein LBI71_03155 [Enterobacteriaceae bacterium]|jgi:hypothetical protein|nr:hypothetical protein [Enterobacteriaceae bacterium]
MSPIEARIVFGRMLSEGICAEIIDEEVVWNNYMCSSAFGGVKLLVHHLDQKRAQEILSEIDDNRYLLDEKPDDKKSVTKFSSSISSNRPLSVLINTFLVLLIYLISNIALPIKFDESS